MIREHACSGLLSKVVRPFLSVVSFIAFFLCSSHASAHSLYISAWIEGSQVCTESIFSTKSRVKNGTVSVLNAEGRLLQKGLSDENGNICFPLPPTAMELTYVVNAGQGHRAETVLYEEDFPTEPHNGALLPQPETLPTAPLTEQAEIQASPPEPFTAQSIPAELEDLVRTAVRDEIRSQLDPIRRSIAALQTREAGVLEIFGGIGWIAGLSGVAMMVACRRRKN